MRKRFESLWRDWNVAPHPSINWQTFSEYYTGSPDSWNRAFAFLTNTDLAGLSAGVYDLIPGKLIVMVQEYITRKRAETQYEAHRKYADIQYVVKGAELMGIARLQDTSVVQPYDDQNDIVFLHATRETIYHASRESFFVFFPDDAHRPCIRNGSCGPVKKIVVKIGLL